MNARASGMIVAALQIAIAAGAAPGGLLADDFGATGAIGDAAVAALLGAVLVIAAGGEEKRLG